MSKRSLVVGMDLGDKYNRFCVLDEVGESGSGGTCAVHAWGVKADVRCNGICVDSH